MSTTSAPRDARASDPERRRAPTDAVTEFSPDQIEGAIPDRFERIVRRYPDRLALKTKDEALTYDAFNQAANRVAHAILARRRGGDEPVALLVEAHLPMLVATLGALKAGAICVPLDPLDPEGRTTHTLHDAGATLVVTNTRYGSLARRLAGDILDLINMDELDPQGFSGDPDVPIPPGAVAYIIYTTGSTGRPKGVVRAHCHYLHDSWVNTKGLRIGPEDRLTLLASPARGQGVVNAFSGLLNGCTLYPFNIREEGFARLANWLADEGISVLTASTPVLRSFLDVLTGAERFPHLRVISLRSEQARRSDLDLCWKVLPADGLIVHNIASTESGIFAQFPIERTTQIPGATIPVGYAVQDKEILLLDPDIDPAGGGRVGEIAVKSRYVALGYWRQPDLTAQAFLPDPEGGERRIYRTGDLGRLAPDGCLTPLGRKDTRTKIRGFRIELGAVEAALLEGGAVKEAVVMVREDRPGDHRLTAYIVPAGRPAPTGDALRRLLAPTLPAQMIPSTFVTLGNLPLTPSGKVDRNALPAPDRARPDLDTSMVAPRTPIEAQLAAIWQEVLGLERVGIHDGFFDLGGNSLLASRIVARALQAFRVELPLRSLFEAPTVAAMAAAIAERGRTATEAEDIVRTLEELEGLSDAEAQRLLGGGPNEETRREGRR